MHNERTMLDVLLSTVMKLYLARHTQSNYNAQGLFNGDLKTDVHLNEIGLEQAGELAEQLEQADFQAIFTSEFKRTQQTAEIINSHHHKPIIADPRINEIQAGYEEMPLADWKSALSDSAEPWTARFNGGESMEEAFARADEFAEYLRSSEYSSVLVITHGFFVESLHGISQGISGPDILDLQIPQGEYKELEL